MTGTDKTEQQFFANAKPRDPIGDVFDKNTRNPGAIHARVCYLLTHHRVEEAKALVESRSAYVQESTRAEIAAYPRTRIQFDD